MSTFTKTFKAAVRFNVFANESLFVRIDAAVCGESVPLFTIPFCMSIATKAVFDKSKIIFFFKSFMMFLLSNNNVFYVSKS